MLLAAEPANAASLLAATIREVWAWHGAAHAPAGAQATMQVTLGGMQVPWMHCCVGAAGSAAAAAAAARTASVLKQGQRA